ncbi:hypothetical protein ACFFNY_02500 [Paenibacillus hodogayensis]|uniref:Uncharacterized protein n=1 Tax=Paenibacillus hodogayensis TaxID=279208 RepID=A0ABV5VQ96_9BACL
MFVRFHANYASPFTKQPYGIFVAIFHLKREGILSPADTELYDRTVQWFEENLPNPPFYEEHQNSRRAVTWFKDGERTRPMIAKLAPFLDIAARYEMEIIRSVAVELPGTLVYENDYQIAVTIYPAEGSDGGCEQ